MRVKPLKAVLVAVIAVLMVTSGWLDAFAVDAFFWATIGLSVLALAGGPGGAVLGAYEIILQILEHEVGSISAGGQQPDPNFSQLATVGSVSLTPFDLGPSLADMEPVANSALSNMAVLVNQYRALETTVERYFGAINAGDPPCGEARTSAAVTATCSDLQRNWAFALVDSIEQRQLMLATQLDSIRVFEVPLFDDSLATSEECDAYRNDVVANGLQGEEATRFAEIEGTSEELAGVIQLFVQAAIADAPASMTADAGLAQIADGIRNGTYLNVRSSLPPQLSGAAIPVLGRPAAIALLALVIGFGIWIIASKAA